MPQPQHYHQRNTGGPDNNAVSLVEYPSIQRKVIAAFVTGKLPVLFTDIDATLVVGSGHHESEIVAGQKSMHDLVVKLNEQNVIIIPVSGSHFDTDTFSTSSISKRIKDGILPPLGANPAEIQNYYVDAYVSDGGAKAIANFSENNVTYDPVYSAQVQPTDLNYDVLLNKVKKTMSSLSIIDLSENEKKIIAIYDPTFTSQNIYLQPGTENGHHKNSNKIGLYFYASSLALRDQVEKHFKDIVSGLGLQVVCCEEKDANSAAHRNPKVKSFVENDALPLKYCLDIVPFDKSSAVSHFVGFISELLAHHVSETKKPRPILEVWACGDAANDYALMSHPAVSNVVIVGGASKELVRMSANLIECEKSVYIETDPRRLGPASITSAFFKN